MNITVSVPTGVKDTTNRLTSQMKACPEQKFAIVGYSQGAGVMHAAAVKFDSAVISKIAAAVMFGDPGFKSGGAGKGFVTPGFPAALQAKLKENCNPGDPVSHFTRSFVAALLILSKVCDPKGGEFSGHLAYSKALYQTPSAEFIVAAFKGLPLPKAVKGSSDPSWPGNAGGKAAPMAAAPKGPAAKGPSPKAPASKAPARR
jgi:cutinase